jgi:hypothetical protein
MVSPPCTPHTEARLLGRLFSLGGGSKKASTRLQPRQSQRGHGDEVILGRQATNEIRAGGVAAGTQTRRGTPSPLSLVRGGGERLGAASWANCGEKPGQQEEEANTGVAHPKPRLSHDLNVETRGHPGGDAGPYPAQQRMQGTGESCSQEMKRREDPGPRPTARRRETRGHQPL